MLKNVVKTGSSTSVLLARNENQAFGLASYAKAFMKEGTPSQSVLDRVKLFHTDSVLCGISALALKTNAPTVLKDDALTYSAKTMSSNKAGFAKCFGSNDLSPVEKAICSNVSAVREWDSNGTVFGYRGGRDGHQAGEFGHNDFYPVVIAAAFGNQDINGATALKAMCL